MKAYNATTSATDLYLGVALPFIHIQNVSDTDVYVAYDGAIATVAAGYVIPASGGVLQLNNPDMKLPFTRRISVIHGGSGNKELRVQGCT